MRPVIITETIDKAVAGFADSLIAGDTERAERFCTLAFVLREEQRSLERPGTPEAKEDTHRGQEGVS